MPGSGTGVPVTLPEAPLANEEKTTSNVLPGAILSPVKVMVAGNVPPGPY